MPASRPCGLALCALVLRLESRGRAPRGADCLDRAGPARPTAPARPPQPDPRRGPARASRSRSPSRAQPRAPRHPRGVHWAQRLALFLLLWVAFIGASMATHDGAHLKIDAARKACPHASRGLRGGERVRRRRLHARVFTSGPLLPDHRRDGGAREIPDWLKVLAARRATLVSARFLLRGVASLLVGSEPTTDDATEGSA